MDLLQSESFLERGGTRSQICRVEWPAWSCVGLGTTTRMVWDDCSLLEPPEWTARVSEWHPGKYHLLQMFLAHSEQHLKYRVSIFYAQKTSVNTIAAIRRLKELGGGLQCLPSCQWVSPETPQNTLTLKTLFSHPRLLISGMFKLGQRPLQADTRKFIFLKTLTKSGNVLIKMLLYTS